MEPIAILINGLPGKVARELAEHTAGLDRFDLLPVSLTGPEITDATCRVGEREIRLFPPDRREAALAECNAAGRELICIDFTHPSAVDNNARFYCRHGLPFVMGTTGGDRRRLMETVESSQTCAVIAPNMARQIVGFQAMLAYAAETFPGLFTGYRMTVRESHQQGKADTSGTAKAVVAAFNQLGVAFSPEQIHKERDPRVQHDQWNIPEAYLDGHGWHTYSLESADGTVNFAFTHNVNGRQVYLQGTLEAVEFLHRHLSQGARGQVFSMIDVLKG